MTPFVRGHHRIFMNSIVAGIFRYIDTTKIKALMLVWYRLVFNPYSYNRDFFCLGPEPRPRKSPSSRVSALY